MMHGEFGNFEKLSSTNGLITAQTSCSQSLVSTYSQKASRIRKANVTPKRKEEKHTYTVHRQNRFK